MDCVYFLRQNRIIDKVYYDDEDDRLASWLVRRWFEVVSLAPWSSANYVAIGLMKTTWSATNPFYGRLIIFCSPIGKLVLENKFHLGTLSSYWWWTVTTLEKLTNRTFIFKMNWPSFPCLLSFLWSSQIVMEKRRKIYNIFAYRKACERIETGLRFITVQYDIT